MNAQDQGPAQPPERHVEGRCMTCGFEGEVIERTVGAGFRVHVCERCSFAGQQALAAAQTLRPFAPFVQKFMAGLLDAVARRR